MITSTLSSKANISSISKNKGETLAVVKMKRDGNRYILKITYAIVAVGVLVVVWGIFSLFMSCRDHRVGVLSEDYELANIKPAVRTSRQRDSCPNLPPPPPPNSLASNEENMRDSIQAYERFRQVGLAISILWCSISLFLSLSLPLSFSPSHF